MDYDKEFIKQKLASHRIDLDDEAISHVQSILKYIEDGERELDGFTNLKQKTPLTLVDKEEMQK